MDDDDGIDQQGRVAIWKFFQSSERRIFKTRELQQLISGTRANWGVPASVPFETIVEHARLRKVRLAFPSRPETRYCVGNISVYELAMALGPQCYLTHHTALFLNGLLKNEPNEIYVNSEQSEKPRWETSLEQDGIDWAYQQKARTTNNVAEYDGRKFFLLSGKHTEQLGVVSRALQSGPSVQTTSVERTLVDAVVRPIYCGGIVTVHEAFRRAKGKMSVHLMAKMLKELDYLYPYHQSIGFLLERSGAFLKSDVDIFDRMPKEYDFYLDHQMDEPKYSERWRLHYPSVFDQR